ncbi:hypothetical protein [Streptomyces sennicomposti]
MRDLFVRPSAPMRSEVLPGLEPLGPERVAAAARALADRLGHGRDDVARTLWQVHRVHDPRRRLAVHGRPVRGRLPLPPVGDRREPYVHTGRAR